jgi:hypothetical protein
MNDTLKEMAEQAGVETASTLAMTKPELTIDTAGRLVFRWHTDGVIMTVESTEARSREFGALIEVHYLEKSGDVIPLLSRTRINFRSASAKETLARKLTRRLDRNWDLRLEYVANVAEEQQRTTDPPVWLDEVTDPGPVQYLVDPILELGQHTVILGDGGSSKSFGGLSLGLAGIGATGLLPGIQCDRHFNTLLLDYEANSTTHARRQSRLLAGIDGATLQGRIAHKRMTAPLADVIDEIQMLVREYRAELVIIDSAGMACGGEIKDEPAVLAFFAAARRLNTTVLSIAHVTKSDSNGKPIGSQYWHSQPRSTWEFVAEDDNPENELSVTWFHRKSNDQAKHKPMGWRIEFALDSITYHRADPADGLKANKQLPVSDRAWTLLLAEPGLEATAIAERIGVTKEAVLSALKRGRGQKFMRMGDKRPYKWAVIERKREGPNQRVGTRITNDSSGRTNGPFPLRGEEGARISTPEIDQTGVKV